MVARVRGRYPLLSCFLMGLLTLINDATSAQDLRQSCEVYRFEQTRDVPSDIVAFFDHQRRGFRRQTPVDGAAVRRCRNLAGNVRSSFLSPVEKHFGVCHYGEDDISDLFSSDGRFVPTNSGFIDVLIKPHERMFATTAACPGQESDNYIHVQNVSPGLFRIMVAAYAQLTSSPRAFDAALSQVNSSPMTRAMVASFRQSLRGRFGTAPLPSSITYRPAFFGQSRVGAYSVVVSGGWHLEFEFTESGLKVVDLQLLVQ